MPTEWKENNEFYPPPLTGQYINKTVLVDLFSSFQKKKKLNIILYPSSQKCFEDRGSTRYFFIIFWTAKDLTDKCN